MSFLVRAMCLLSALAIAGPAMAQHRAIAKTEKAPGYQKACGDYFRCYNGVPLQCASNTRPYQNVANRKCICVTDGCPQ